MKKRKHHRPRIRRPHLAEIAGAFALIDAAMRQIASGEVFADEKGTLIFQADGEWCETAPALLGWVDLWQRLSDQHAMGLNMAPLAQLANRLSYDVPLTPEGVEAAKQCVDACRKAYRNMDIHAVKSVVRTQEIAVAMRENLGAA